MELETSILELSSKFKELFENYHDVYATAESCTGGLIGSSLVEIPGSSAWFDRGFITYSNEAKMDMLGVKKDTLDKYGAVSEQVVKEMAQGAIKNSNATIAVSVSGIAGPDGGTEDKPVGTVWMGICKKGQDPLAFLLNLQSKDNQNNYPIRKIIRLKTVYIALNSMILMTQGKTITIPDI